MNLISDADKENFLLYHRFCSRGYSEHDWAQLNRYLIKTLEAYFKALITTNNFNQAKEHLTARLDRLQLSEHFSARYFYFALAHMLPHPHLLLHPNRQMRINEDNRQFSEIAILWHYYNFLCEELNHQGLIHHRDYLNIILNYIEKPIQINRCQVRREGNRYAFYSITSSALRQPLLVPFFMGIPSLMLCISLFLFTPFILTDYQMVLLPVLIIYAKVLWSLFRCLEVAIRTHPQIAEDAFTQYDDALQINRGWVAMLEEMAETCQDEGIINRLNRIIHQISSLPWMMPTSLFTYVDTGVDDDDDDYDERLFI